MWECNECYAQVEDHRKNRHRSWHTSMKNKLEELESMIRRK